MKSFFNSLLILGLVATPGALAAQDVPDLFQFRISNPGARSLGFGGAFAALADDATAAYANPAGLVQLLDPEITIEGRLTFFSGPGASEVELSAVGYASFVYPLKRWSLALYRAGLARSEGLFSNFVGSGTSGSSEIDNLGLAGAYRWTDDFSVGFGIASFQGVFSSTSVIFDGSTSRTRTTMSVDESDVSFNAGFLWHLPRRWDLGGFFRQGPSFTLATTVTEGTALDFSTARVLSSDPDVPFDLADVYGLGAAYQTKNGAWTFSFEWDHVGSGSGLGSADELHLGLEYVILERSPILALRLGAWDDPGRRSSADSLSPVDGGEFHWAVGLGLVYRKLQLDFGLDQSDQVGTISVSVVYAF